MSLDHFQDHCCAGSWSEHNLFREDHGVTLLHSVNYPALLLSIDRWGNAWRCRLHRHDIFLCLPTDSQTPRVSQKCLGRESCAVELYIINRHRNLSLCGWSLWTCCGTHLRSWNTVISDMAESRRNIRQIVKYGGEVDTWTSIGVCCNK